MAVPVIQKIVINTGITETQGQAQALKSMAEQLAAITGQRPKTTKARFPLPHSNFVKATHRLDGNLRGRRMYEFLDRLISIVMPRVKDFQGVSRKSFDA
jgi:large subunit ribosomal protein L5